MACSSCNRNNRRSNNWGCRKAVQSTRWPSWSGNTCGCSNGCNSCGNGCTNHCNCGCGSCTNGCNTCNSCSNNCTCGTSCGSCSNNCNGCNSTCGNCSNNCNGCNSCSNNCNTCTSCGGTTVCTGTNTVFAQPGDSRSRWNRRGWNCANQWSRDCDGCGNGCSNNCGCWQNRCFPFYCGPCGPVEPVCGCANQCGCSDECGCGCANNCGCSCQCREPVFGFFTQVGTIDVNSGGVIPFNGGSTVEGIWKDGGELTLETAGVYMVTLGADIPENVTLYTELDVRVNGVTNPGGRLVLDKDYTDAPLIANTQTVITVNEGAVVTVTSSEGIAFSTSDASQPIVTLSIVKIS